MANWSNPTLTSLYTDFVTEVKNRDVDLALGLDPATTSPSNVPTNAIRWNSANSRWEKYTSGSWGTLTATYALTSLSLTGSITFEGATDDAFETTLTVADPTADRTITLPNVSGTVVTTGDTGSITSTMIADGAVVNADISASAAIAHSKLANITAGQVLLGNASNIPTATALTGDITIDSSGVTAIGSGVIVNADINASAAIADTKLATISTAGKVDGTALTGTIPSAVLGNSNTFIGTTSIALNRASANQGLTGISSIALPGATSGTITVTPAATAGTTAITIPATSGTLVTTGDSGTVTSAMIADGTIVNADVNASAAIAGTKISPDFGSQNVTTTGTSTAAGFIPSSATVPSNGLYLPAANQLGFSTASTSRLVVDASGNLGLGVVPSAWSLAGGTAIQTPAGSIASYSTGQMLNVANAYYDAGWKYVNSSYATQYQQASGQHTWYTAPSGTAGAAITFTQAMTLDASGRLLVGTTTDSGGALLQINDDRIRVATAKTPASATAAGTAGEVCWDANYIYVCTATNTWKRAAIATW